MNILNEEQRDKILETKAEKICSFDCGIYGICYCKTNNEPDLCENKEYSKYLEEKYLNEKK